MDPFIGEIRMFAGNFPPENWHYCDGATMTISGNEALYALIGTVWGGDGATTFKLPDLRGRLPVGQGTGPHLAPREIGQQGGTSTVQIQDINFPTHNHTMMVCDAVATTPAVAAGVGMAQGANSAAGLIKHYAPAAVSPIIQPLDSNTVTDAYGGGQPHYNIMPYLTLSYIISLSGFFPTRPS